MEKTWNFFQFIKMNCGVVELSHEVSQASLDGQTDLALNPAHSCSPAMTANRLPLPVWSWNFKFMNVS